MRRRLDAAGYQEVKTPQLLDRVAVGSSGHWDKYREHMFIARVEDEDKMLALKPMNCPCHVQIFRQGMRSLPRTAAAPAEFGSCHRYEPSGALHGIMRVRAFTQDDAHIFCTEDQIAAETVRFVRTAAVDLPGFRLPRVPREVRRPAGGARRQPTRCGTGPRPRCARPARRAGIEYELNPGEGAFYGPKLEFVLRDAIGRDWQCGTLQVDFVLPERLDAEYVGEDGAPPPPGHAAPRHPGQLRALPRHPDRAICRPLPAVAGAGAGGGGDHRLRRRRLCARGGGACCAQAGLAVETDLSNQKINAKVREHSLAHVPVLAVVGRKEAESRTVALRRLGGEAQEVLAAGRGGGTACGRGDATRSEGVRTRRVKPWRL